MKTEISKGTQKFIWHLVAFAAVFVLALVIICRVLPEPNRTATVDQNSQITTSQTEENLSTDFDSVKERVDQANNTTGKEVKSLYTGEGKSTMQKQLETRLFFNTLKSILICVLLAVVVIILIKKGFNIKKFKKIFDEDDESPEDDIPEEDTSEDAPVEEDAPEDTPSEDDQEEEPSVPDKADDESKPDEEEPPIVDPAEPDEQEVAEKCKL